MTAPLTDQQLAVWAADLTWLTKGPWLVAGTEYDQPMIYVEYEGRDGTTAVRTLLSGASATEADVQFMTRSPERIATLLAEVARLRAELEQARATLSAVGELHAWLNLESGKKFVFADELIATLAKAQPACTCGARPVHQTGCDTDQNN